MVSPDDKSPRERGSPEGGPLERLESSLYRKDGPPVSEKRSFLHPHDPPVKEEWMHEEESEAPLRTMMSLTVKIFIAALVFFVIASGISLFIFFGGGNVISTKNVDITITGPVAAEAGKEFSFQILVENKNNADLEFADLIVEYPEGAEIKGNREQDLLRTRTALGTVPKGHVLEKLVGTTLFGQEGDEKEIKATLEYRIAGSNAIFVSEKKYSVFISSSPLSLSIEGTREIVSGQEFELAVKLVSNSSDIAKGLLLAVDYPFGFSFIEATPEPVDGNNVWKIGDLPPSSSRVIRIRGVIEGQDGDEKIFKIEGGTGNALDNRSIKVLFASSLESVRVVRPSLGVTFILNGQALSEFIIFPGKVSNAEIAWVNNTPTRIVDAKFEVSLMGEGLNRQSVSVREGFYRSTDSTVVWDKSTNPELASLEPGARGSLDFTFSSLPVSRQSSLLRNPEIDMKTSVFGERLAEIGGRSSVENSFSRAIKVNSELGMTARGLFYAGPFTNTGTLPPHAEEETSYTILWTVVNSSNTVRGGEVVATMPSYVRWVGAVSPQGETVLFNATNRTVRWKLGDIEPGIGITSPAREVAFQIALLPSVSQIGEAPLLIGEARLQGTDGWTGARLFASGKAIDTRITADPRFKPDDDRVIAP